MIDSSAFPIVSRWPAQHPDRIQLYSVPTPNGVKVAIMLEETGLPYEAHFVNISANETWEPPFQSLNPNGKIPAILDPQGPGGRPFALWESGAILIYLAEKAKALLPADPAARYETIQWVMWQMGGLGPFVGQLGYFYKFAGREIEDKRPLERFAGESKRLLALLNARLSERQWVMGDEYTIADIAMIGWVRAIPEFYGAGPLVNYSELTHVQRWVAQMVARPAVARGLAIPARP